MTEIAACRRTCRFLARNLQRTWGEVTGVSVNCFSWPPSIATSLAIHNYPSNNYQTVGFLLPSSTVYNASYSCVRRLLGRIYKTNGVIQYLHSPSRMCGGKCGIKADLPPNTSVCLCQFRSNQAPYF